jgi:hypothetical protein
MRKLLLFSFLIVNSLYSQEFDWNGSLGGVDSDSASAFCIDKSGNLYNSGIFYGEIDLNQDTIKSNLFSSSGLSDFYIQKTDPFGSFIWAKKFGGDSIDRITDIKYFENKIFVSGQYSKTISLGSNNHVSNGKLDAFIMVLDTSGTVINSKSFGGVENDLISSIQVNAEGLYLTGNFSGSVLDLIGDKSAIISKLNPTSLQKVWSSKIGVSYSILPKSITIDDEGSVFVSGNFSGDKIDFNPSDLKDSLLSSEKKPSTTFYTQDAFILKLNNTGEFKFVKKIGGTTGDEIIYGSFYRKNKIAFVGQFAGSVLFGGTNGKTLTSNGKEDIFVSLYNLNGDLDWVVSAGGSKTDFGKSVFMDSALNVYSTGTFFDTDGKGVDFDPSSSQKKISSNFSQNSFVWKLTSTGIYSRVYSLGGSGVDNGVFIIANDAQEIFSTGNYEGDATFLDHNAKSLGKSDIYLLKLLLFPITNNYIIGYEINGKSALDYPYSLEIYRKDISSVPWFNNEFLQTNANDYDGEKNSILIDSIQGVGIQYAVKSCINFVQFAKDDWYLPSKEELELMYKNKNIIGGLKDYPYWSSSEVNQQQASYVDFTNGVSGSDSKASKKYVRPVRKKMKNDALIDNKLVNLELNPNPTKSICVVSFDARYLGKSVNVELINSEGRSIKSLNETSSNFTMDLSSCEPGIYFVRISNNSFNTISKIIKE